MAKKKASTVMFGYTRTPTMLNVYLAPLEFPNRGMVEELADYYFAIRVMPEGPEEIAYALNASIEEVAPLLDRRTLEAIEAVKSYLDFLIDERMAFIGKCAEGGVASGEVRRGDAEQTFSDPNFNASEHEDDAHWSTWEKIEDTYPESRIKPEHYLVFKKFVEASTGRREAAARVLKAVENYKISNKPQFRGGFWFDKFILEGHYKKYVK